MKLSSELFNYWEDQLSDIEAGANSKPGSIQTESMSTFKGP